MAFNSQCDEQLFGKGFIGSLAPRGLGPLNRTYGQPPFSVLDTRQESWKRRRRAWLNKGIKSEIGRKENLTYSVPKTLSDGRMGGRFATETSVFDPVLCELMYSWFCPLGGVVLDPFAGGSVRGIVASLLGRKYWGCELRPEQVASNKAQAIAGCTIGRWRPIWRVGDCRCSIPQKLRADFTFSCPPYGDLEKYSDDPNDLSNMGYAEFVINLNIVAEICASRLKQNRFACIVVANFRDKKMGLLRNLVGDTVTAFQMAGMAFYNDILLINSFGTAGVRTANTFERGSRKVVKCHQNVLVFVKGDPKKATTTITKIEE